MAVYRVVAEWAGPSGAPYFTTLHFRDSGGTAQQAATAARTFLVAFQNYISSSCGVTVLPEVFTIDLLTGEPTAVTSTTTTAFGGAAAGDPLPRGTQLNLRFRTGTFVNGHEVRGRFYLPMVVEAENDTSGNPSSALRTAANAAGAALIADANSLFCVYSKVHKAAYDVASVTAVTKWSFLRSRRD